MALGVPVKVTVAKLPGHTDALPEILTTGVGITVMVILALSGVAQLGVPAVATLIKV